MYLSEFSNKTLTTNMASNNLAKIGINVSVLKICQDSQRQVDTLLPTRGTPPLLLKEVEVKISNAVVAIQLLQARVTYHGFMAMDNYMHKGTPTANIFRNK